MSSVSVGHLVVSLITTFMLRLPLDVTQGLLSIARWRVGERWSHEPAGHIDHLLFRYRGSLRYQLWLNRVPAATRNFWWDGGPDNDGMPVWLDSVYFWNMGQKRELNHHREQNALSQFFSAFQDYKKSPDELSDILCRSLRDRLPEISGPLVSVPIPNRKKR